MQRKRIGASVCCDVFDRSAAPEGIISIWLTGKRWQQFGKVDEDGSFVLTGLPKGSYTIQARCNQARAKVDGVASGAEGVTLTLAMPE